MKMKKSSTLATSITFLFTSVVTSNADLSVNVFESNSDIIVNYVGSLEVDQLFNFPVSSDPLTEASIGHSITDATKADGSPLEVDILFPITPSGGLYALGLPADATFTWGFTTETVQSVTASVTGAPIGIQSTGGSGIVIVLPTSYATGDIINTTVTFEDVSFDDFGYTTQTFNYTAGTESLTLNFIPEPTSSSLLGFASLIFLTRRRRS